MKSIKYLFSLFIKKRRLKKINREVNKYQSISNRLNKQQIVVNLLLVKYKETYGEDLRDHN